jgi:flagellar hook assembly protein FlgD
VEISVYDVRGTLVRKIWSGGLEPGFHSVEWDGTNNLGSPVASGVYFYQLKTEERNLVRKMQLLR